MKIRNLIKMGKLLSRLSKEEGVFETLGKSQRTSFITIYGLHSSPAKGSKAILFSPFSYEDAMKALSLSPQEEVSSGEIWVGIPEEGTRLKMKAGGGVSFKLNKNEGGDFLVRFEELKKGFDQAVSDLNSHILTVYNIHTHGSPSGVTTTPAPFGSASTASIDSSKIDEIEVP